MLAACGRRRATNCTNHTNGGHGLHGLHGLWLPAAGGGPRIARITRMGATDYTDWLPSAGE